MALKRSTIKSTPNFKISRFGFSRFMTFGSFLEFFKIKILKKNNFFKILVLIFF